MALLLALTGSAQAMTCSAVAGLPRTASRAWGDTPGRHARRRQFHQECVASGCWESKVVAKQCGFAGSSTSLGAIGLRSLGRKRIIVKDAAIGMSRQTLVAIGLMSLRLWGADSGRRQRLPRRRRRRSLHSL